MIPLKQKNKKTNTNVKHGTNKFFTKAVNSTMYKKIYENERLKSGTMFKPKRFRKICEKAVQKIKNLNMED